MYFVNQYDTHISFVPDPGQTAPPPDMNADKDIPDFITDRVLQEDTTVSTKEPFVPPEIITTTIFSTTSKDPDGSLGSQEPPEEGGAVAAVTISIIGVIALIVLVALLVSTYTYIYSRIYTFHYNSMNRLRLF